MTAQLARRGLLAGLVACLLLVLAAVPANAHANLVDTDPADGQVVATAPETITVRFDEPISLAAAGNQLFDAQGEPVEAEFAARDAALEISPAEQLGDGTYVVSWRVISADSHPVTGGITFSVGAPSENVVTVPVVQAEREVTLLKGIAEFVRYAGVLLFAGLAIFVAVLATPITRRDKTVRDRLLRATLVAGLAAVVGAVALIPLTALWESGEGVTAAASAFTTSGPATAAAGLVAVGVAVGWFGLRRGHAPLTGGAIGLTLGSLIVVGHTRSYGPFWLVLTADLLHVAAAAIWIGGVIGLVIALRARPRARDAADTVGRFSSLAAWALLLLGLTATVLYWRIAGSIEGLWESTYGRLVLAKLAATLVVAAIGGWNRRTLVPRVGRSKDAAGTLRRTLVAEAALLTVVVGLTSALVAAAPPASQSASATQEPEPATLTLDIGDGATAEIRVTPGDRGVNAVEVALSDGEGRPLELEEIPQLSVALESSDIGPFDRPLSPTGPGTYEATADFPLSGVWTLRLSVRLSQFHAPVVSGEVEIP
ncbi:copper resistance protein CopC [uncultured Aeromicrobium sp.]|uniref:copper resistance CopC/CopD family protein n=1 Tax=uncultured Aeromicrobium sp. TaxID=337820 RepID=UPI0025CD3FC0|nr:copper resistance protein CopC [uncultured Aeromicrobium sp.]